MSPARQVVQREQILPAEALLRPSLFMVAASRERLRLPKHIVVTERFILDAIRVGGQMLTIELPVRTGKSTYVNRFLPSWFLGTFPHKHVGLASHEAQFASSWGAQARDTLIEFGSSFGVSVSRDVRSRAWWEIEGHGGSMRSFGIAGGGITGRGFDLLILDDLIKNAAEADSEVHRDAQWNFLQGTVMSRLEPGEYDPEKARMNPGATLIVMMARWHEDDLIGRIHREMPGRFRRLRLPAIAEEPDDEHPEPDALGRAPGEPLWPTRFPLPVLEQRRRDSGDYYFNANYQQRPSSPQGTVFQRKWWKRWRTLPAVFDFACWSWDMSFKDTAESSYVVGGCWGKRGADLYLRWQVRGQWSFSTTKAVLRQVVSLPEFEDAASHVFVEDKANGPAIIDDLKREIGGLIAVSPGSESKLARARAVSGYVESGNVWIPDAATEAALDLEGAPWTAGYVNEHAGFPRGANDDQVDATSQAIREMLKRGAPETAAAGGQLPERRR